MFYNKKKEYTEMINMKKLFLLVILALTIVSCELFSPSRWERVKREDQERGVHCYKQYGNVYCEDRDGNSY